MVAYFSMEIALDSNMPTYSGGLGVLAGDTVRSAADLHVPMLAVSLLHRKGYFRQRIIDGWQSEEPVQWDVSAFLRELPQRVSVLVEGRKVFIRAWVYKVTGVDGSEVPVYFLDTDLAENSEIDRTLTDFLYGGDERYRLCQEIILGIGGIRMLRAIGHTDIRRYHMNEGHAGLLTLELLDEVSKRAGKNKIDHDDVEAVRKLCVFTTHTPVAAGHDKFSMDLVNRVLGRQEFFDLHEVFCCEGVLNMTYLALNLSHYVNGVAKKHGEVSRDMFPKYKIDSITNGVHASGWVSKSFQDLFDQHIPGWRLDNFSLRNALRIPRNEIWESHMEAKIRLIQLVNASSPSDLEPEIFTLGFARRATAYKRADLLFYDTNSLKKIASHGGRLQIVYAGKAHPKDQGGKEIIRKILQAKKELGDEIKVVYLENYDMDLAKAITSGVDLWLNTPEPPMEASGTSGMKAALNGVPSLSVLDGWWLEGCIEGVTGWAVGNGSLEAGDVRNRAADASSLYEKLEKMILPLYYGERNRFIDVMRHAVALNGSFFNTQRMVLQYVMKAYSF